MAKVKAIQVQRHGGPEQLRVIDLEVGEPGAGEVRIRHHAIGVNFVDIQQRTGKQPQPLPLLPGMEAAGVVEALGPGVTHVAVGDRVAYASHPPGAYSQARVMPAPCVCRLPDAIDFETAAGMMLKGLTAQFLLRKIGPPGGLAPGDVVLVHAAAGGVGLILTQWASALGLQVIGTAGSDDKCELALRHGASHMINYRRGDFPARVKELTGGRGVKLVYDAVGRDTWEGSLDCLQRFGTMVSYGNASGPIPAFEPTLLLRKGSLTLTRQSVFHHLHSRESTQAMADDLFEVVAGGQVRILIGDRFPLAQAQQAHRALEARQTVGSTIIVP